jgi:aryl-alcohol dehydrogenase-like predicted oxidoreductase
MIDTFTELTPAPSKISLGTCSFGSNIPDDQAFRIFDAHFEAGGNFIDTAHVYSAREENGDGAAERCTGAWLWKNGVRDKIVISTKGGHPPLSGFTIGRCSYEELDSDLNESLDRLGVDQEKPE